MATKPKTKPKRKTKAKKEKVEVFNVKRIRMLITLASPKMAYPAGHSFDVPGQVPIPTAKSWLASGAAEEDKSLPAAPETK